MPVSIVHTTIFGPGGPGSMTIPATTAGNALIIVANWDTQSTITYTPASNFTESGGSDVFSELISCRCGSVSGLESTQIYYCFNITGGITSLNNAAGTSWNLWVIEVSGCSIFDDSHGATGTASGTNSAPTLHTHQIVEALIVISGPLTAYNSGHAGSPFTYAFGSSGTGLATLVTSNAGSFTAQFDGDTGSGIFTAISVALAPQTTDVVRMDFNAGIF